LRRALESGIDLTRGNLNLRHQRGGRTRTYRLFTVYAVTNFQMSAYAERLASHSRNSLSKTESTPNRSGWQGANLAGTGIGTGGLCIPDDKDRPGGRPMRLMASHWPPENAPGGKLHSIRRPHLLWVFGSFGEGRKQRREEPSSLASLVTQFSDANDRAISLPK
jgi:hypothetical protein